MNIAPENPNALLLSAGIRALAPLLDRIVLVGGCATGLLITDPAAAPVRATLDVDVIVEIASYAEFICLEDTLRELGFHQSLQSGAPVCRWLREELILDVMPTDTAILGFTNRWYRPAFADAQKIRVGEHNCRLITAPYFLATKLEAFHGRGHGDYRVSHDLEDIVTVLDGRAEAVEETNAAAQDLREFLDGEFRALLANPAFIDALPGYLPPDAASQRRAGLILERIKRVILKG
jgi:predicted nucleotidyltransferase